MTKIIEKKKLPPFEHHENSNETLCQKVFQQLFESRFGVSKATLKKPAELNVPADKFEAKFGVSWQSALDDGLCFNAIDGAKELGGLDAKGLEQRWRQAKKDDVMIKFGGGFYCAKLDGKYVFNGFFMYQISHLWN